MSSSITNKDWLSSATAQLQQAGITTARIDCLVLLEDETKHDRSWLLAHPEYELEIENVDNLSNKIIQRTHHKPLAYIRNTVEFYGRKFSVNSNVLVPRPESESIIDLLKGLALPSDTIVADIGTGSGALAVTAKLELPGLQVVATDIDPACLEVARRNAKQQTADVTLHEGNLLAALPATVQSHPLVLICNLPYIPEDFPINQAASHEPRLAIFSGTDGLDLYRQLFDQLKTYNYSPLAIITEALPAQHKCLVQLAQAAGYHCTNTKDFIQLFERN